MLDADSVNRARKALKASPAKKPAPKASAAKPAARKLAVAPPPAKAVTALARPKAAPDWRMAGTTPKQKSFPGLGNMA
ncbi:MAG: hypothetical protein HYT80_02520 [Euryarchaeota archaeon]|nr:hypothetical protein [Euryarchaeota archaeon]